MALAGLLVAYLMAASRIAGPLTPIWQRLPAPWPTIAPAIVALLPQVADLFRDVNSWQSFAVSVTSAIALLLPGITPKPPAPPSGGAGDTQSNVTHIVFPDSSGYPPDEPAECSALPWWSFLRLQLERRRLTIWVSAAHVPLVIFPVVAVTALACARDVQPCSLEDLADGPLARHSATCAARRQLKFPNYSDDRCDATPACKAIVDECDRWAEERCK